MPALLYSSSTSYLKFDGILNPPAHTAESEAVMGGDGFWSVVGKTSTGSADDLLSLGRGGGGGGGGGGGNAGYAEDVGFLVTCPKLRNIRNTVLEAQRILKHFSCVQEKKKVETETEPPQVSHEIARNRQRNTMYGPPPHNLCFFIQPAPCKAVDTLI